jgi:FKBP-type peptidyl-prolyl cis-trans isomerase (trigger factor)
MKTDVEKLKKEYEKSAKENLKLEFILHEIGKNQKVEASKKDIEDLLKSAGSKEVADRIRSDAREMANLKHMIVKRKTVNKLISGDL